LIAVAAILGSGCASAFRQPTGEVWVYEVRGLRGIAASWGVIIPAGSIGQVFYYAIGSRAACEMAHVNSAARIAGLAAIAPGGISVVSLGDCQRARLDAATGRLDWWAFSLSGPLADYGFVAGTEALCSGTAAAMSQRFDIPWRARPSPCTPVRLEFQ
jgi:hypothetical protein